jgi:hypothetical protein
MEEVRRRCSERIPLQWNVAVPVQLRTEVGPMHGVARNVSSGGMLVEADRLPPIGSRLEVTLQSPWPRTDHGFFLLGDVRHHHHWSFIGRSGRGGRCGFGIRFLRLPHRFGRWLDELRRDLH